MPIKHAFASGVADGTTAGDVRTTHWNADHVGSISGSTAAIPEVLTRVFSITSSNTAAATTLVNYAVPARTLGTNRMLRWTMMADVLSGSSLTSNGYTMEVFHGGSSRWKDTFSSMAAVSAVRKPLLMQIDVAALNSSGTRSMSGFIMLSSVAAATFGLGDVAGVGAASVRAMNVIGSSATFTVTTGVAENFVVQHTWLLANSSLSFRMHYGVLELI